MSASVSITFPFSVSQINTQVKCSCMSGLIQCSAYPLYRLKATQNNLPHWSKLSKQWFVSVCDNLLPLREIWKILLHLIPIWTFLLYLDFLSLRQKDSVRICPIFSPINIWKFYLLSPLSPSFHQKENITYSKTASPLSKTCPFPHTSNCFYLLATSMCTI